MLAAPSLVKAEAERTLRFVPFVDLSVIDPVATVATPARNHGFLVFNTLYGVDANYRPFPQMIHQGLAPRLHRSSSIRKQV
ncbi:MAG: hypothetical protein ACRYF2_12330 [Janthinobacterium lividum]